jgi:hypothetical protein
LYINLDAALAGLKTDDHIIEINGKNIQKLNAAQVKKPIIATKYPEPLELLVADAATYNYYKQQNKTIQHGLASVQKLPENVVNRNSSPLRRIFLIIFSFIFTKKYFLYI